MYFIIIRIDECINDIICPVFIIQGDNEYDIGKNEIGEILKHSFEVFKEHFKDILGYSLEILKIFILLMK